MHVHDYYHSQTSNIYKLPEIDLMNNIHSGMVFYQCVSKLLSQLH